MDGYYQNGMAGASGWIAGGNPNESEDNAPRVSSLFMGNTFSSLSETLFDCDMPDSIGQEVVLNSEGDTIQTRKIGPRPSFSKREDQRHIIDRQKTEQTGMETPEFGKEKEGLGSPSNHTGDIRIQGGNNSQKMMEPSEIYKCGICGKCFKTKRGVSLHIVQMHQEIQEAGRMVHTCRKGCSKVFKASSSRNAHEKKCDGRGGLLMQNLLDAQEEIVFICRKGCGRGYKSARSRGGHERACKGIHFLSEAMMAARPKIGGG